MSVRLISFLKMHSKYNNDNQSIFMKNVISRTLYDTISEDSIKDLCKISQGLKEKIVTERRLKKYSKYLNDVIDMFQSKRYRLKIFGIRKIQVELCEAFNLTTDRASWRTIPGMLGWFCMIWEMKGVPEFVQNKVTYFIVNSEKEKSAIHIFQGRNKNRFEPLIQGIERNELPPRNESFDELNKLNFDNEIDLFPQETLDIFDF